MNMIPKTKTVIDIDIKIVHKLTFGLSIQNIPYGQLSAKLSVIQSFGSFGSFGSFRSFGKFGSLISFWSFG